MTQNVTAVVVADVTWRSTGQGRVPAGLGAVTVTCIT